MKPIKRGMTEAVTRDGRKVTQLTWFEVIGSAFSVAGVIDGLLHIWTSDGLFLGENNKHEKDIFAPVEYEWQWFARRPDGFFDTTGFHRTEESAQDYPRDWQLIYRIEESKREVK